MSPIASGRLFVKVPEDFNWDGAHQACLDQNADLASIHSDIEFDEAIGVCGGATCYIGLYRKQYTGNRNDWTWTDGTAVDWIKWVRPIEGKDTHETKAAINGHDPGVHDWGTGTIKLKALCRSRQQGHVLPELQFDGVNDLVQLQLPWAGSPDTISMWINIPHPTRGAVQRMVLLGNAPDAHFVNIELNENGQPSIRWDSDKVQWTVNKDLRTATWQHFAFVRSNSELRFYLNGTLLASVPKQSSAVHATTPSRIGADNTRGAQQARLRGRIHHVRVYAAALSRIQVRQLSSTACCSPIGALDHSLLGGFHADLTQRLHSSTYVDCSSHQNNGTLFGTSWSFDSAQLGCTRKFFKLRQKLDFAAARLGCQQQGAELASIHSHREWLDAVDACGGATCYIGLFRSDPASTSREDWKWTDGSKVDWMEWVRPEIEGKATGETRAAINGHDAGVHDFGTGGAELLPLCRSITSLPLPASGVRAGAWAGRTPAPSRGAAAQQSPSAAPARPSAPQRDCAALGWTVRRFVNGGNTSYGLCASDKVPSCKSGTFNEALGTCAARGTRLCTLAELEAGAAAKGGCEYERSSIWSHSSCPHGYWAHASTANLGPRLCARADAFTSHAIVCCADAAPRSRKGLSNKTCEALGWSTTTTAPNLCMRSLATSTATATRRTCSRSSYVPAMRKCESTGSRMCTAQELEGDRPTGTLCGGSNTSERQEMWSSTQCGASDHNHLVATNKPTRQSSTADQGISSRAVDYSHSTAWKDGSCTKTQREDQPWWQVDLQRVYNITSAVLWTSDEFSEWMVDIRVLVCNDPDCQAENMQECAHANAYASGPGEAFSRECKNGGLLGRYLRLQSTRDDAALCFCEVFVYGRKFPGLHTVGAKGLKQCRTVTDEASVQCCADSAVAVASSSDILTIVPPPLPTSMPLSAATPSKPAAWPITSWPSSQSTVAKRTKAQGAASIDAASHQKATAHQHDGLSDFVLVVVGAGSALALAAVLAVVIIRVRRHQEERMSRTFQQMNDLGASPSRSRQNSDVGSPSVDSPSSRDTGN